MQPVDCGHVFPIHNGTVAGFADAAVRKQDRQKMSCFVDDPADVVVARTTKAACGIGAVLAKINHGTPPVAGVYPILA